MLLLTTSCDTDVVSAGADALIDGESVVVQSDTIRNIESYIFASPALMSSPDSFLLGECTMPTFGTLKADIITQFACPVGFQYPESAVLDSVSLFFAYRSWVGDGESPLRVTAYEIDGQSLSYRNQYGSDIDVSSYCSMSEASCVVSAPRLVLARDSASSSTTTSVRIALNQDFAQRLFAVRDYSSQEAFNNQFKGLYITTSFGSSTLLYVCDICLAIHYHYSYDTDQGIKTQSDTKFLYANSEVCQVNRYAYPDRDECVARLQATDTNYIVSPANIYTRVRIPMRGIKQRIIEGVSGLRPYVNLADLRIDVLNGSGTSSFNDDWASPAPTMLLIKENAFSRFFYEDATISDTCAIYSVLSTEIDSTSASRLYYYSFSMVSLLTNYLRDTISEPIDTLNMLLVPVEVTTTTSATNSVTTVSSVRQQQSVSVTKVRSAQSMDNPMDIEIVYSGFGDVIL